MGLQEAPHWGVLGLEEAPRSVVWLVEATFWSGAGGGPSLGWGVAGGGVVGFEEVTVAERLKEEGEPQTATEGASCD